MSTSTPSAVRASRAAAATSGSSLGRMRSPRWTYPGSQAGKGLGQFRADGPPAQDHQTFGGAIQPCELLPQGIGGDIAHLVQPRQLWHHGLGAGGDDDAAGGEALCLAVVALDLHGPGIHDGGVAGHHVHSQFGIAFGAVVGLHLFDHPLYPVHYGGKIRLRFPCLQAEVVGVADLVGHAGAFDQRLAGHTAVVEAVAPHLVGLHQCHFGAHRGGDIGGYQTTGAGADHHHVAVVALRLVPSPVHPAALHPAHDAPGDPGEQPQQDEGQNQLRRENVPYALHECKLGAGIDVDKGARQHPDLAHPIEGPGFQTGQGHDQVDHEKREDGHQAQCEQIKGAVPLDAAVDGFQPFPEALLHAVAQQKARHQKSESGPDAGGEGDQQHPLPESEKRACGDGHDGRPGQGQGGDHDVEEEKGGGNRHRIGLQPLVELRLGVLQLRQGQVLVQIQGEIRPDHPQYDRHSDRFLHQYLCRGAGAMSSIRRVRGRGVARSQVGPCSVSWSTFPSGGVTIGFRPAWLRAQFPVRGTGAGSVRRR